MIILKKLLFIFIISLLFVYPVTHTDLVEAKTTNGESKETKNVQVVLNCINEY